LTRQFYNDNANELAQHYLSKTFEEVHQSWSQFLPSMIENPNARILDLGAGSGRDVKYLAEFAVKTHNESNTIQIFAVEPVKKSIYYWPKSYPRLKRKMVGRFIIRFK